MAKEIKKKLNLKLVLIILLILIALIVAVFVTDAILGRPYDKTMNTYKSISVSTKDTADTIGKKLEKKGIISDANTFKFLSSITLRSDKYKDGSYLLSPSMNFNQISQTLIKGVTTNSGFSIPAGYNIEQIAAALDQAGFVDKDKFVKMSRTIDFSSFDFIDSDVDMKYQLEGFLLPRNYKMDPKANEIMIITTMLDAFDNMFSEQYKARADELGMSIRDVVILASMIERTTTIDDEKPYIAAIIHNKLNLGMDFKGGYPENPLCSPSEESIKAALYPEETEDTYYVLSSKLDGSHIFTSDKDEYKKLIKEYKDEYNKRKDN